MTSTANPMRVVIRVDASLQIGTGHVMRCLTLAAGLAGHGAQVEFISRVHDGHLIDLIKARGFAVISLPNYPAFSVDQLDDMPDHAHWLGCDWQTDADQCRAAITDLVDWVIVDHYALDHRWETTMRDRCRRLMCIDDLADRSHDCDLLLDQNLGRYHDDYRALVPKQVQLLLGPKYAMLRPEFAQFRDASLARRETPQLHHILVTMGGVDGQNITGRILTALRRCDFPTLEAITVVLGPHAPWLNQVLSQAGEMSVPTQVLSGVDNMAELMTSCDLAIGAGGSTTWERCALGVPSILVVLAKNQRNIADCMDQASAAFVLDTCQAIENAVCKFLQTCWDSGDLRKYSQASAVICDGTGIKRVVSKLDRERV